MTEVLQFVLFINYRTVVTIVWFSFNQLHLVQNPDLAYDFLAEFVQQSGVVAKHLFG